MAQIALPREGARLLEISTYGRVGMKKKTAIIGAFTPEAILKRKIRAHLRKLGFRKSPDGALLPPSSSKESIRAPHFEQRKAGLKAQRRFVQRAYPALQHHFAKDSEIDPEKVEPALELIDAHTLSVGELILVSACVCGFRPKAASGGMTC